MMKLSSYWLLEHSVPKLICPFRSGCDRRAFAYNHAHIAIVECGNRSMHGAVVFLLVMHL
ncbi:hypothetical protein HUK48_08565 [Prevotella corporis]|nr:hypothetical protein [Prevotella corporis]